MKPATTARDLRGDAILWLRDQWPDAVIIPELSVASMGGARLDLAAVTPTELIGVEIKGEGDSTARLALQGMQYSAVCSRLFLLPCPSLREKCAKARPPGWLMATSECGDWWKNTKGARFQASWDFGEDHKRLPTSPYRLLEVLWGDELKSLARVLDVDPKEHRGHLLHHLAENFPLAKIRSGVLRRLYLRRWESARFGRTPVWRPNVSAA